MRYREPAGTTNRRPRLPASSTARRPHGAVPEPVTVFDDEVPAVVNLDSGLLAALRRAATDAAHDGVEFFVNGGWRSSEYQGRLFHEAISKYGSPPHDPRMRQ
jgi:D-alanyl-D-alanine carboxypeptidase